ncbi:glycosyl hydrolase 115 family protein [Marinifilum sp. RC60d5]|uniref:glycosyl hydrolase 115 family protein n=1 Tax=Marinifilum sp. RC60d5 TaxID=3458414 RepID=UPI004035EC9D
MILELKNKIVKVFLLMTVVLAISNHLYALPKVYLVQGEKATQVEKSTILDFKNDISKVIEAEVIVITDKDRIPTNGTVFLLGTIHSNKKLAKLSRSKKISLSDKQPGARGGIWAKLHLKKYRNVIVLGGSDVQGLQYAIYDYSHQILNVDPFEYWTGKVPVKKKSFDFFNFDGKTIAPPLVPIMCYFENDVDELANYRGKLLEYDWESYTEMINSLVRIRYNAIQFFDMLGRPEFFVRPAYKKLSPNYQIDEAYLEKMIDYAHLKGMQVQIDLSLGYQIHPLSVDESYCWTTYKEKWIEGWKYYFEKTAIAKADIFSLRPRHQVWDWEYTSACGEDKIVVFNEVYSVLGELIDHYKPNATKIAFCYHDGMEMFNEGFNPPKDWIAVWCDDGFGDFDYLPKSTKGYDFGTYMHAGFWKNHTVHNPYPMKVDTIMKKMFREYGADKYCQVNGQNFRPFLFNLEAYSEVCNQPENFNGEDFYQTWCERYFSKEAARSAVKSMKILHEVQTGRNGYVQHLWEILEAISYLSNKPIELPGKDAVPYSYERVENDIDNLKREIDSFQVAIDQAEKGMETNIMNKEFYYSYILLPVHLYSNLISFESTLHEMALLKREFEQTGDKLSIAKAELLLETGKEKLKLVYKNCYEGDQNQKWDNWYSPEIRRPNNGFPTFEMLDSISETLKSLNQ